jgi:surfactin synthase thioesterase subunit
MLTIADHLLSEAQRRGVLIRIEHGELSFDGPEGALDERFVNLVRANDRMILQRLSHTGADGRWLKPITTGPGEALLFLLPAAGTGPERYRSWQEVAPDGLEIVAVQPPGREERFGERPFTEVAPLADEIAERVSEVVARNPGRPFALFGHSAGALVAYEVARRLTPSPACRLLAVAAASPPDLVRTDLTTMNDEELLRAMAEWTDTPLETLTETDLISATLPCLRADLSVHESSYRTRTDSDVLDLPIMSFSGRADRTTPPAECAAWEDWTTGDFTFHSFEGAHFFPVSEGDKALQALAEAITGSPARRKWRERPITAD